MKRFIENWKNIFLLPALAAPMLAGCSDDFNPNRGGNDAYENGVVVYVPSVMKDLEPTPSTRTRGELNDFQAKEGEIKSLHLFAYPVSGNAAAKVIDLTKAEVSQNAPEGYSGYKLEIDPGSYRLYVVANVSFSDASAISEDDLKNYSVTAPASAKNGLPMSCANSEMMVQYNGDTGYASVTDATGVNMASGAAVKVKADLKFAVTKVRVTMLNDMRPELKLEESGLNNLAGASSLMPGGEVADVTTISGKFAEAGYYELPEMKEDLLKVQVDNMTSVSTPGDTWAWQGTTYVAERLFDNDVTEKSTVALTLSDGTTKVLTIGTAGEGLKRSYFYDYVGNSKGKFVLDVQPWDPVTIAGALHGPYFLHVDQTDITIEAGEQTSLWFESNAQISCISNTYTSGETEIPIYNFTIKDNEIKISVNPEIKGNMLDAVKAQDGWRSFTIKAGTILKRIEVKELNLHEFLTVDVNNVTIDVREQVASGTYSGAFIIPIRTNLNSFSITPSDNWPEGSEITLCDPDGQKIENLNNISTPEGGVYNLQLKFSGLNDGKTFWQATSQMQFTVSGTPTVGDPVELPVTVNVLASSEDYIIHLYAPGWNAPHIYVYQSLELPADHPQYPNGIVSNGDGGNTAYEYIFSGAVAFRGWNVPYNGVNYNNPNDRLEKDGYAYKFTEGNSANGSWDAGRDGWLNHYYVYDFCEDYRAEMKEKCSQCKNVQIGWPGAVMLEEGGGWWKFVLSGLATPGKALMMFTDNHNGSGPRYPEINDPGIPLFDYPSREGWIDVSGSGSKQFSPNAPAAPQLFKYRIYWPYSNSFNGLNIWNGSLSFGNSSYSNFSNGSTQTASNGNATYHKHNDQYAYIEFENKSIDPMSWNYQRMPDHKPDNGVQLPNNYKLEDGYYCYTITGEGTGYAGKPDGSVTPPTPSNTYRIYWKYNSSSWNGLNFWGDAGIYNAIYDNYPNVKTGVGSNGKFVKYNDSYVYLEFTTNNVITGSFNYQKRSNDSYFDKTEGKSFNLFTKDEDGVYCYTIDQGSGKPSGSVTPPTPSEEYVTYRIAWPYSYSGIKRNKIYCYTGLPDGTKVGNEGDTSLQNQDYTYNDKYINEAYFVFRVPSNADSWTITNVWIKRENGGEDGAYTIHKSDFKLYEGSDILTYKITSF